MLAFPNVARDGKILIVPRDADLSPFCLRCAHPSAGRPITCHLRMDKSGAFHKTPLKNLPFWFFALELFLFAIFFFIDLPASRKRKLTFGLCQHHRRQRFLMLLSAPLSLVAGGALVIFGIFSHAPTYLGLPATILGLALLITAGFLHYLAPGPRLTGQNPHFFWIKGAGKDFLEAHPAQAPMPKK